MQYKFLIFFLTQITISLLAQNLDVDGKMLVKDVNTIGTFRSAGKNSFIRLETQNDPFRGTSIGYFDDNTDKYFYIDTPEKSFGELRIDTKTGNVGIGTDFSNSKLSVRDSFGRVEIAKSSFGPATIRVTGFSSFGSGGGLLPNNGTALEAVAWEGYGIYAESQDNVGVYSRGGFNGESLEPDFWAANGNYGNSSSRRWKNNIMNISHPLEKLARLRGVSFDWDTEHGGKHAVGLIAEEVGEVLPEIVWYEDNGVDAKGMDYSKMTSLLVEAANAMRKEYQEKLNQHRQRIEFLEQELASLKRLITENEEQSARK